MIRSGNKPARIKDINFLGESFQYLCNKYQAGQIPTKNKCILVKNAAEIAIPVKKNAQNPSYLTVAIYANKIQKTPTTEEVNHTLPKGTIVRYTVPKVKKITSNPLFTLSNLIMFFLFNSESKMENKETLRLPRKTVNKMSEKLTPNIATNGISRIAGKGGQYAKILLSKKIRSCIVGGVNRKLNWPCRNASAK